MDVGFEAPDSLPMLRSKIPAQDFVRRWPGTGIAKVRGARSPKINALRPSRNNPGQTGGPYLEPHLLPRNQSDRPSRHTGVLLLTLAVPHYDKAPQAQFIMRPRPTAAPAGRSARHARFQGVAD